MPRLITLLMLLPLAAFATPPAVAPTPPPSPQEKPLDLSVSPEEHALRDLIPGWEPVRPLTEDEMIRPDSPFQMQGGGFPRTNFAVIIPTIPPAWTTDWPEPGPLLATGVPRGWWWKPKTPKLFGAWIVLAKSQQSQHVFDMVTLPLRTVDHGSVPSEKAMQALYLALRDREAKRRGIAPAVLDREAKQLEARGRFPSAMLQAREAAIQLDQEDKLEDAIELLTRLLDEDAGTERERVVAMMRLGGMHVLCGEMEKAAVILGEARDMAIDIGATSLLAPIDEIASPFGPAIGVWTPAMRLMVRAIASFDRGNLAPARQRFEQALAMLDERQSPGLALTIRYYLASIHERMGDRAAARAEARRALALVPAADRPNLTADLHALIAKLDAANGKQSSP